MEKLQPELRFPEFDNLWGRYDLNDLFFIYDGTHQTPNYTTEGIPFVSVESIKDIKRSKKFISVEAYERDFKIKPKVNDILMTRITAGIIGDTAIVENDDPLAYYVSLALLREKLGNSVEFLNHNINSNYFKEELHKRIIHTAFPKKINLGEIGKCTLSVPSLPEQTKIAEFLTAIDKRIELLTAKKEKLTLYKKGVMQKIFNQEIRFKKDDGEEFPEWEEKKIRQLMKIKNGRDYKHLSKGKIPVFGTGGLMTYVDKCLYDGETVFIGRKGTIDKPYYFNGKFWTVDTLFYTSSFKECTPRFILYCFYLINWKRFNEASGVPSLSKSTLNEIDLNIPSIEEQNKITSFLIKIDGQIQKVTQQITLNQTYKKGLLQQMFV